MAQRLERKLQRLRQDYQELKRELAQVGHIIPRHAAEEVLRLRQIVSPVPKWGPLHGPYHHWTRKVAGEDREYQS
ncbi:MAG TPA: hypothetical protein EYH34_03850 [Planctomycetes bacterium]|nr:hypothetical protein [Planctomycetota bacterium]